MVHEVLWVAAPDAVLLDPLGACHAFPGDPSLGAAVTTCTPLSCNTGGQQGTGGMLELRKYLYKDLSKHYNKYQNKWGSKYLENHLNKYLSKYPSIYLNK